jgi:hypothetical protein
LLACSTTRLPAMPRRDVTAGSRGFEPLIAEKNKWDVGA